MLDGSRRVTFLDDNIFGILEFGDHSGGQGDELVDLLRLQLVILCPILGPDRDVGVSVQLDNGFAFRRIYGIAQV